MTRPFCLLGTLRLGMADATAHVLRCTRERKARNGSSFSYAHGSVCWLLLLHRCSPNTPPIRLLLLSAPREKRTRHSPLSASKVFLRPGASTPAPPYCTATQALMALASCATSYAPTKVPLRNHSNCGVPVASSSAKTSEAGRVGQNRWTRARMGGERSGCSLRGSNKA